jgi:methylated-DNA-[protein]-cysteine S-methyltransferase
MTKQPERCYGKLDSPVGALLLVGEGGVLREVRFDTHPLGLEPDPGWREGGALISRVASQLESYFTGRLERFDLPLEPQGTPFQRRVWRALGDIPFGTTLSYGELAARVGNPKASRAVGAANGRNPIPLVIPCHRVIGRGGQLTGFGGGIDRKRLLLKLEGSAPALFFSE